MEIQGFTVQNIYSLQLKKDNYLLQINLRSVSVNNLEQVIETIHFSNDWKNIIDANEKLKEKQEKTLQIGQQLLALSDSDWAAKITSDKINDTVKEVSDLREQICTEKGMYDFLFKTGDSISDFTNKLREFATNFGYGYKSNIEGDEDIEQKEDEPTPPEEIEGGEPIVGS